nr:hypothetical protein [Tanacetum cinerariifolium]
MCDPGNYVFPVKINGIVEMVALVDTGASLPLLLERPFLRTYGPIIDMGGGTLCIDDGVIRHTYFPKPRSKSYVEAFETEGEDDWLGSFEVGRDDDGNVKYGLVAPSFIDIKDDKERALAMEAYFNPSCQDGKANGNKGYNINKLTPPTSLRLDEISPISTIPPQSIYHPLIAKKKEQIIEVLDIKYKELEESKPILEVLENYVIYKKKLDEILIGYGFEDTLREMMKLEYIYEGDGDVFVDYSWEGALSINNEIYPEWVLEFFSTLYFDKDVDRNNLTKEKCIWLESDDKQFDYKDYWTRVGKPTLKNHKEVLVKEPLMRIVHKVIIGSLVHRVTSREMPKARFVDDECFREVAVICAGHYVTKIACFLGYCMDDEIKKCSELIDCFGGNSSGYAVGGSSREAGFNDDDDMDE